MHVVLDVEVEEVVEADGVVGGDKEVVVADLLWDLEGRSGLRPVLPDELLGVVEHVENVHFLGHFQAEDYWGELVVGIQAQRREQVRCACVKMHVKFTKLLAAGFLHGDTQGPNTAEGSEIGEDIFNLFWHFGIFFIVDLEVGAQDAQVGVDKGHL